MFSKAKSGKSPDEPKKAGTSSGSPLAQSAAPQSAPSKKANSMKSAGHPSIISTDVVMRGNINSAGEIQFDGSLEGDIKAGSLIIGDQASVKGEVVCETVTVRGRVEGGIRAKSVSLAATAQILGDILHSSLSVETGAHFEGNCRHSDDPLSDSSAKDFRRSRPSSPTSGPRTTAAADEGMNGENGSVRKDAPSFLSQGRSPLR